MNRETKLVLIVVAIVVAVLSMQAIALLDLIEQLWYNSAWLERRIDVLETELHCYEATVADVANEASDEGAEESGNVVAIAIGSAAGDV